MKKIAAILSAILSVSLLSACGGYTYVDAEEETPSVEEVSETPTPDEPWRKVMADYLQNVSVHDENDGYQLIYLDDDDIPELVEIGNCAAAGCRIVSFPDGAPHLTQLRRLNFTYIERSGLLRNTDGNMGYYSDDVYKLQDGVMELISEGTIEETSSIDSEGNAAYEYLFTLNGESVASEEEYRAATAEIYDDSSAKTCLLWPAVPYSAQELVDRITGNAPQNEALNAYRELMAGDRSFNLDGETVSLNELINSGDGSFLSPMGFAFTDIDEDGANELIIKLKDYASEAYSESCLVLHWEKDGMTATMENPESFSNIVLVDFLNENIRNLNRFYA